MLTKKHLNPRQIAHTRRDDGHTVTRIRPLTIGYPFFPGGGFLLGGANATCLAIAFENCSTVYTYIYIIYRTIVCVQPFRLAQELRVRLQETLAHG